MLLLLLPEALAGYNPWSKVTSMQNIHLLHSSFFFFASSSLPVRGRRFSVDFGYHPKQSHGSRIRTLILLL